MAEAVNRQVYEHGIREFEDAEAPLIYAEVLNLAYYAQAWHLPIHGKPLLEEEFWAWVQAPDGRSLRAVCYGQGVARAGIATDPRCPCVIRDEGVRRYDLAKLHEANDQEGPGAHASSYSDIHITHSTFSRGVFK
jgi:hypothetical protein